MKAFFSLLIAALIEAVLRWWNSRRDEAARRDAGLLRDAVASVGEAQALEKELRKTAQAPESDAPVAGDRRVEPSTGRMQVWTGSDWRDLLAEEGFFNDAARD